MAESAAGAVAGHKGGVIAQGPELAGDAIYQLRVAALRKVRAAHAARKQHVAHKGQAQPLGLPKPNKARNRIPKLNPAMWMM